jgi:hypothetical protein
MNRYQFLVELDGHVNDLSDERFTGIAVFYLLTESCEIDLGSMPLCWSATFCQLLATAGLSNNSNRDACSMGKVASKKTCPSKRSGSRSARRLPPPL